MDGPCWVGQPFRIRAALLSYRGLRSVRQPPLLLLYDSAPKLRSTPSSSPNSPTLPALSAEPLSMDLSGPRWKGQGFAEIANSEPMSRIVLQLQTSLPRSGTAAFLAGDNALLCAESEIADLLNRAAFGRELISSSTDNQIFQLGPEEAFYLSHSLKCLKITRADGAPLSENELWAYLKSANEVFPELFMAYKHLRSKNWVAKPGIQYGVDFVAYRHHPALVHSEYAVIVVREGGGSKNGRLSSMTDLHCALRACRSVAKTLLKLSIRC